MPAEWEPHAATWLSWPRREGISFPDSFDRVMPTLRAMVEALLQVGTGLHQRLQRRARSGSARSSRWARCKSAHVSSHSRQTNHGAVITARFFSRATKSRAWRSSIGITTRGAASIRRAISMKSCRRASREILGLPVFYPRMILEGGSIDVNGAGALLTSESCLLNPESQSESDARRDRTAVARLSRGRRNSLAGRRNRGRRHRWPHR